MLPPECARASTRLPTPLPKLPDTLAHSAVPAARHRPFAATVVEFSLSCEYEL